jgi:hypothetical protein
MLVARAFSAPTRSSITRSTPPCGEGTHWYWRGTTTARREKSALISIKRFRGEVDILGCAEKPQP